MYRVVEKFASSGCLPAHILETILFTEVQENIWSCVHGHYYDSHNLWICKDLRHSFSERNSAKVGGFIGGTASSRHISILCIHVLWTRNGLLWVLVIAGNYIAVIFTRLLDGHLRSITSPKVVYPLEIDKSLFALGHGKSPFTSSHKAQRPRNKLCHLSILLLYVLALEPWINVLGCILYDKIPRVFPLCHNFRWGIYLTIHRLNRQDYVAIERSHNQPQNKWAQSISCQDDLQTLVRRKKGHVPLELPMKSIIHFSLMPGVVTNCTLQEQIVESLFTIYQIRLISLLAYDSDRRR